MNWEIFFRLTILTIINKINNRLYLFFPNKAHLCSRSRTYLWKLLDKLMTKEAQDESLNSEDLCSLRQEGWSITCPGSAACIAYSSTAWTASPSTLILTQKCAQTLLFFHSGILWRKRDTSHRAKISLFYPVHPFQTVLCHYPYP